MHEDEPSAQAKLCAALVLLGKRPTASSGMCFQGPLSWSSARTSQMREGGGDSCHSHPRGCLHSAAYGGSAPQSSPLTLVSCCQPAPQPSLSSPEKSRGHTCPHIRNPWIPIQESLNLLEQRCGLVRRQEALPISLTPAPWSLREPSVLLGTAAGVCRSCKRSHLHRFPLSGDFQQLSEHQASLQAAGRSRAAARSHGDAAPLAFAELLGDACVRPGSGCAGELRLPQRLPVFSYPGEGLQL